ncbi:hypothetical protein RFI_26517 [Reticulomyxa filosa]|uniref:Uncharacterized protein n=1 Tax=Reticulomyxa filosa TaxID=46433 RepID=X6MCW9_RETFI|nr:hypothetical protein RFI_26517 [Reticulomyxa filosa]|eukprot:ETO10860.1 hypothetical protein RFI_26517 [Reticulomyxa filosa]
MYMLACAHTHDIWCRHGLIEAKLRSFVGDLEEEDNIRVAPYNIGIQWPLTEKALCLKKKKKQSKSERQQQTQLSLQQLEPQAQQLPLQESEEYTKHSSIPPSWEPSNNVTETLSTSPAETALSREGSQSSKAEDPNKAGSRKGYLYVKSSRSNRKYNYGTHRRFRTGHITNNKFKWAAPNVDHITGLYVRTLLYFVFTSGIENGSNMEETQTGVGTPQSQPQSQSQLSSSPLQSQSQSQQQSQSQSQLQSQSQSQSQLQLQLQSQSQSQSQSQLQAQAQQQTLNKSSPNGLDPNEKRFYETDEFGNPLVDPIIFETPHCTVSSTELTCCDKISNEKLLALKNDYSCKAFVIGFEVISPSLQGLMFSAACCSFLSKIQDGHKDGCHCIVELLNCTQLPHFLFERYTPTVDGKRPKKHEFARHQIQNELNHQKWSAKKVTEKDPAPPVHANDTNGMHGGTNGINDTNMTNGEIKFIPNSNSNINTGLNVNLNPNSNLNSNLNLNLNLNSNSNSNSNLNANINTNSNSNLNATFNSTSGNGNGLDKETGYGGIRPHRSSSPSDDLLDALRNKNLAWSQMNNAKEISICENNGQKRRRLPDGTYVEVNVDLELDVSKLDGVKIDFRLKRDDSPSWDLVMYLYKVSQKFKEWSNVSHDCTANTSHMLAQLLDREWKRKVSQLLAKYGWNGCKYVEPLKKEQMQEMAETLGKLYILESEKHSRTL